MSQPLISVLIPTYNVAPFVEEAIRSIMEQTYQNLEIIVVDDASKDSTYTILQALAAADKRIKLFRNEKNSKIVDTLNFAIQQASGEFYARMDGDDVSLPTRIEAQFVHLQQHPEVALVGINALVIDEQGKSIHEERFLCRHEDIRQASKFVSPVLHNWLARASLYRSIGNYRIPSAEDLDFILRALDAGFKLANLPEPLYLLRQRQGNTATTMGLIQIRSIAYVRQLHAERLANNSSSDSYSEENLKKALDVPAGEKKRFELAANLHFRYVLAKNKSKYLALLYRAMSIAVSPVYQMRPILNRQRYKQLIKKLDNDGDWV